MAGRGLLDKATAALSGHLHPGERLFHVAYGFRPASRGLVWLVLIMTAGTGLLFISLLTKYFYVGVTDRRVLFLRVGLSGPQGLHAFDLGAMGTVHSEQGPVFARLLVPVHGEFLLFKFHRAAFPGNREAALAIAQACRAGSVGTSSEGARAAVPATPGKPENIALRIIGLVMMVPGLLVLLSGLVILVADGSQKGKLAGSVILMLGGLVTLVGRKVRASGAATVSGSA